MNRRLDDQAVEELVRRVLEADAAAVDAEAFTASLLRRRRRERLTRLAFLPAAAAAVLAVAVAGYLLLPAPANPPPPGAPGVEDLLGSVARCAELLHSEAASAARGAEAVSRAALGAGRAQVAELARTRLPFAGFGRTGTRGPEGEPAADGVSSGPPGRFLSAGEEVYA